MIESVRGKLKRISGRRNSEVSRKAGCPGSSIPNFDNCGRALQLQRLVKMRNEAFAELDGIAGGEM
jgi:hypothetical protein